MITLLTGGTGDGKTALAVKMMINEYAGRPIYSMGIPELLVEHFPVPPVSEWTEEVPVEEDPSLTEFQFRFPANAVIFIDEAQKIFRPRHSASKVPPEVQAFETHRHEGIDWVLITQSPKLLDSNVRALVKRHLHIWPTPVGKYLLELPKVFDPEEKASRDIAARVKYQPPKEVFGLYKSAEAHTVVKRRLPWYVWGFGIGVIVATLLIWRGYTAIQGKLDSPGTGPLEAMKNLGHSPSRETGQNDKLTRAAYIAELEPRIPGQFHTAPRYDDVTKPVDAPFPAACIDVAAWRDRPAKCRCLDQQGNDYKTTEGFCRQVAHNGYFKDWGNRGQDGQPEAGRPASDATADKKTKSAIIEQAATQAQPEA